MSSTLHLHIALCDDQPAMLDQLEALCSDILKDLYPVHFYRSSSLHELLPSISTCQIALLDVQLADECGIDLAREILQRNPTCRILFVSGFLDSVSQVYEVPHFCFILKNQLERFLPEYLLRAAHAAACDAARTLTVFAGRKSESIDLADIAYIERNIHQSRICTVNGQEFICREKLSELMERIDCPAFCRCHVSYIVNLRHVKEIENGCFVMNSGEQITISRPNEKRAREAFFAYLWDKT